MTGATAHAPLLAVEGLGVTIHGAPVLEEIAFSVDAGEVLGIVGESGSGKSMTANAIMQLLPDGARCRGSVRLAGAALDGLDEAAMCRFRGRAIGMIFQEPMTALNPVQTIGDQVAETVRIHTRVGRREAFAIARRTLDRVGLPEARFPLDRYPHDLSGGQRQRVVIAMAIALKPKLLIADEPTTALDVTTQAQILELLARLVAEDGMGLILISHDLAVVAGMADRVVVMKEGRIVEAGPTVPLFRARRAPYTRALFKASAHSPIRRPHRQIGEEVLSVAGVVRDYARPRRTLFGRPAHVRAVDDVSLSVRRGENVGLVGESGCGKSTLARAILGLEPLQAGTVALAGRPFHAAGQPADATLRRQIQAVFQDPYGSFNPRHTVERLVAEPFHLLAAAPTGAERRRRVGAALEAVGLAPGDARRFIHEFSGGQRQRIAIARALIIEPAVIILDEAVSALDVSVRAQILDLLADLSDRLSLSCLFISHDLSVVRAMTDRVLVMKSGRIVEAGETASVFAQPKHPYTQSLLAATPDLESALAARERSATPGPGRLRAAREDAESDP